jgi:hypothetical protein
MTRLVEAFVVAAIGYPAGFAIVISKGPNQVVAELHIKAAA